MRKGDIIKNLEVEKLVFGGKGFAKLESKNKDIDGKTIFITGGVVPKSIVDVKIIKKRKDYYMTQVVNFVEKSPIEKKHPDNPYGECGGCKRVNIPYKEQLKIKENQVKESFFHLEKYINNIDNKDTTNDSETSSEGQSFNPESLKSKNTIDNLFSPIIPSPLIDGYRNKIEFSFGKYISRKDNIEEHFNVGFHKQGMFSQIEDFDGCILIDKLQNKIYKEIKDFAKNSKLPVYDTFSQKGFFRHILIRKAFFTNQIMIIFGFNPDYFIEKKELNKVEDKIKDFFIKLSNKYKEIKSVFLSINNNKADIALGNIKYIYGKKTITEKLTINNSPLFFKISPQSFFQTNSAGAEVLYSNILKIAHKEFFKDSIVLDLYAGTGTIGMIFAKNLAKKVYSVELVKSSTENGKENAKLNNLNNLEFINKKVEDFLEYYKNNKQKADFLIIDPPRAGMHPKALANIISFNAKQIIYISCNPSTLSRDLDYILKNTNYKLKKIIPIDMFPHTHHIEVIASLELKSLKK